MTKKLLSVGEVAEMLGVSASSVRLLCDSGKLPFVRPLGPRGHRKIRPEAVDNYIQSLEQTAQAEELNFDREAFKAAQSLAETIADIKKIGKKK